MGAARVFVQYLRAQARYALAAPLVRRERLRRFAACVTDFDFHEAGAGRRLPAVSMSHVFPELRDTTWTFCGAAPIDAEAIHICAALRAVRARTVLEIGTFRGAMTLQLAANVPDDGRVFTVDIDVGAAHCLRVGMSASDRRLTQKGADEIGCYFRGTPLASRVTQLLGDSATIDYAAHFDTLDFAYIDGGHSYAQVRADTEAVLPWIRPGGAVFWHDYRPGCAGVTTYLHELARTRPVCNIRRTPLAALRL